MLSRRQGISLLAVVAALPGPVALAESASAPEIQKAALASSTATLSLRQAIDLALARYPQIKVTDAQRKAAASGIQLARQVYLPRIEGIVNVNRQTSNNVGSIWFFPAAAPFAENIGGRPDPSGASGFTSAVGTYIGWEPFDFGSRRARVEAAESLEQRAKYAIERTKLEVAGSTAVAFLTLLAAEGTIVAAQAAVDRAEVFVRVVEAQVNAQLRPGADASRARAELA